MTSFFFSRPKGDPMAYQKKELTISHMMILRDIIDDWPHTDITPQQFRSELIRLCKKRNVPVPSPKLANKWLVGAGCQFRQT